MDEHITGIDFDAEIEKISEQMDPTSKQMLMLLVTLVVTQRVRLRVQAVQAVASNMFIGKK